MRPALGLYWTLLVEWAFYLLCVMLVLTGSFARPRRWLVLSILLTAVYSVEMFARWLSGVSTIGSPAAFACLNLSLMLLGTLYRRTVVDGEEDVLVQSGVFALLAWHLLALPAGSVLAIGTTGNATIPYAFGLLVFLPQTVTVLRVTLGGSEQFTGRPPRPGG